MLVVLSAIAVEQGAPTENTLRKVYPFLDYAATHPDAVVTYKASDMVLVIHSDASYLSEPKARSRAGGQCELRRRESSFITIQGGRFVKLPAKIRAPLSRKACEK